MSFAYGTPTNQQNIGTTIRASSTSNFLISSKDREGYNVFPGGDPANFNINKKSNILNGFFTRLALNEIVIDYCLKNISTYWNNTKFAVDIGSPAVEYVYTVPEGHYTVAQVLDTIVSGLNALASPNVFNLYSNPDGTKALVCSNGGAIAFKVKAITNAGVVVDQLPNDLNILSIGTYNTYYNISCPKLLGTEFLDFVCPQITNNQALKDSSTALTEQNIIFRWYLASNTAELTDTYGYPIFQGYKPFIQRREIAFPKQIAWVPNQPIGQLTFQIYDDKGRLMNLSLAGGLGELEYNMTMLVTEN